jgi:hypothetical protein
MIGWRDDASFNVFVGYAPETRDWMLIHRGHCAWFLVEVPHNFEVPTNVRRNMQLSRLTLIELFDPGFRSLHLKINSRSPADHDDKYFCQRCNEFAWCLTPLHFFQVLMRLLGHSEGQSPRFERGFRETLVRYWCLSSHAHRSLWLRMKSQTIFFDIIEDSWLSTNSSLRVCWMRAYCTLASSKPSHILL